MSRLVARILLCLLTFPLALILFFVQLVIFEWGGFPSREMAFAIAVATTLVFTFAYWTLLWREAVRWTARRIFLPYVVAAICAVIGLTLTAKQAQRFDWSGYLMLTGLAMMIAWLVATIILWQETALERAQRVRMANRSAITCPACGYNLTGLGEARCPECGAKFTLDELFAAQPGAEAGAEAGELG
jgi:uncharacterized paraquat-inducible protein A